MKSYRLYFTSFKTLVILLLIIGIFFRFINLDKKVYWIDEVHTSVRVSGYSRTQFVEQLSKRQLVGIADLQKYQRLSPKKDLADTLHALAGNAEHSPLYYLMARFWMQLFDSYNTGLVSLAPLQTRSLSAFISLLVFPCLYWLCLELFQSPLVGWMAVALMAISPFHVLYAQEAREYSLWSVIILLSSVLLLRAMRLSAEKKTSVLPWGIYAATVALGFYSHLLFGFVALAQGIYVLLTEKFRFSQTSMRFLLAASAGTVAFLPWLLVFINDSDGIGGWVARKLPLLTLAQRWPINLSSLFFDVQIAENQPLFDIETGTNYLQFSYSFPLILIIIGILSLIGYSIYFLYCHTPQRTWLFVFLLIAIPGLILLLPDLISGGQRSGTGRFLIPCYLGIQTAVAYLLATQIASLSNQGWRQRFWQGVMLLLISGGILSCSVSSQAETWWNKYTSYYNPQIAKVINQASQPLLISGTEKASRLTSLSYILNKNVSFLLVNDPTKVSIPTQFIDIFLFRPSAELQQELSQNQRYHMELVHPQAQLWQLKK